MTNPTYAQVLRENPIYQSTLNFLSIYLDDTRRAQVPASEFEREVTRALRLPQPQVNDALSWLSNAGIIYWDRTDAELSLLDKRYVSKTPLVDELILKASKNMGTKDWPSLRETPLTEGDVERVRRLLKKAK